MLFYKFKVPRNIVTGNGEMSSLTIRAPCPPQSEA